MKNTPFDDTESSSRDFEMRRHTPEQLHLFPTEDLLIPDSLRSMRKAVSAIHATPLKEEHNLSLNSRRLFDAVIMVAQIDCRGRERDVVQRLREDRVSLMFEVRITELARMAGIPGKNYTRVYETLNSLFEMAMSWNIIGEDNEIEWESKSHFLSSLGIGQGRKQGLVRFAFDPDVLALVLEPSQWATLSLNAMKSLSTSAAYALYQNTWRYLGTANKVTAALPTETWIRLLVGESRYVKEEKGQTTIAYGDFKRRVLLDAIERVNSVAALSYTIALKEHWSGRRIARLQFKFIKKENESLGLPLTWPDEMLKVLEGIGYLAQEVEELSESYSYEIVSEALMRLKVAEPRLKSQGKKISARRPYFEGILRNLSEGGDGKALDPEKIAEEARQQEAKKAAELRQVRLKDAFQNHQRECFTSWLFRLDDVDREGLVAEFFASEDATPTEKKLMEKGVRPGNASALAILRIWLSKAHPELIEQALSNPEDRTFDEWMAWKLEGGGESGAQ